MHSQMDHVKWEGFHFYDLIFPLFVFVVGVSIVFSIRRMVERAGRKAAVRRIVIRSRGEEMVADVADRLDDTEMTAGDPWGSYWSWDPKETWALITWLVFATYLHARITKGWEGKKTAILGGLGFFVIWICYLGVNFLGKGLHSYGWLS